MHVIWKRPDGFHGSTPSDYAVIEVGPNQAKLWLHKTDKHNFPFRVSGGWQDETSTKKLNSLVNLLAESQNKRTEYLTQHFGDSKFETTQEYIDDVSSWLQTLKLNLKGDTWELEIMNETFDEIKRQISEGLPQLKKNV